MSDSVISYPIPAYQNLPIDADFYVPNRFVISDITLGQTTVISSLSNLNFVVGQLVRLIVPPSYGSRQLNESQGYVISIPSSTSVELNIDSSKNVDAFVASSGTTQPQILALGNINSGNISASGSIQNLNYIEGSFRNISPQ